jgi:hypothetical protein
MLYLFTKVFQVRISTLILFIKCSKFLSWISFKVRGCGSYILLHPLRYQERLYLVISSGLTQKALVIS